MKRCCALLLFGTFAVSQGALATSMSLNRFTPHVMPVLVQVDDQGQVTGVSSAVELAPRYERLLRQTLDQMITRPANDHGHPVASQFIINLGLQTTPRPDGDFDARFVYVSTSPVPNGSWYWEHIDGHRLALRSQDRNVLRHHFDRRLPVHPRVRTFDRADSPAQSASHNAPRPARARPPVHR